MLLAECRGLGKKACGLHPAGRAPDDGGGEDTADVEEPSWCSKSGWFLGGLGATSGGDLRLSTALPPPRRIFLSASDVKRTVDELCEISRLRASQAASKEMYGKFELFDAC